MSTSKIFSTIFAATAVVASASSLYLYYHHRRLHRSILHIYKTGRGEEIVEYIRQLKQSGQDVGDKQLQMAGVTVPKDVFTTDQYLVAYDRAWCTVNEEDLPSRDDLNSVFGADSVSYNEELLTTYLRRNMAAFARYFPQAYIIKMMLRKTNRSAVKTLEPEFIEKLDFGVGDVVCGVYKVLRREDAIVEFGISSDADALLGSEKTGTTAPPSTSSKQGWDGRLVIGMQSIPPSAINSHGSVKVFSETTMWRDAANKNVVMPLEMTISRVIHELASWWLLESGVNYLKGLRGQK